MHHGVRAADGNWQHLIEALEEFGQGFTLFDHDLKLILCNNRFLEMLDFPASLVHPDTVFADFIRYNARRGEYGAGDTEAQVAERVDKARQFKPHCFQRTRPNGDIIEVRGTPLPGGGFVTIYADVTERMRSEEQIKRQAEYLQSVIANLPQGISVFDENLRLKFWNSRLLEVLDLPEDSVYPDVPFEDLIMIPARRGEYGPGDPAAQVRARRELAMRFLPHRFERTRPGGRTHLIEGRPMELDQRLIGFVTTYTEITDRIATEQEIRRKNDVLQTLFDNIPGGVSLFDKDFKLVAYNAEYKRLLDFPESLFEDEPTLDRFFRFNARRGEYGSGDEEHQVASLLERARLRQAHKFERIRPNGTVLEIRGLPLPDGGFVTIYTDITERKAAEEAINRLARYDSLTGVANRHSLESRLEQSLADVRRHDRKLAVMFIDLDRFKSINDTLGHAVGDELLVQVSRRLLANMREADIVARLGGDEFVVVVSDVADPGDVILIVQKIAESIAEPILVGPHVLKTSASIGLTVFPDDGEDRGTLMKNADIAMYHAKNAGRGNYQFFDPSMNESVKARLQLEVALRHALENDEFVLHYQPQIELASGKVVGVEALIRWNRPGEGLIPPAAFIHVAEEIGLIDALGVWVLRAACATTSRWRAERRGAIKVAVNVSVSQLKTKTFAEQVRAVLAETGLPPDMLELEITESAAMAHPDATISILREIESLGVALAIDDFGTGYSSLSYLKLFPLGYLKLDRTFVKDMAVDANDLAICAASIGLAHNLGLEVVAEGVETAEQIAVLRRLNCDFVQGYHYSRPLPADQAWAFIQDWNARVF